MNSAIVIGSGLGGLQCAYILAKKGLKVTVLEKHKHLGGCLQSYHRGGYKDENGLRDGGEVFDSGFHYVGGLGEGESLREIFEYFDLMKLPWKRLDRDCFDEVVIGDKRFPFANGHEAFAERLSEYFPSQKENLRKYVNFLKGVGDNIFRPLQNDGAQMNELFSRSAYSWLCETISDPLLRKVLSGTSLKMELRAETLPLYIFAQINDSFIRSAWTLEAGGQAIVDSLAESIRNMGGELRTNAEVVAMRERGGVISEVELSGGEILSADLVVSDTHPALTLSLVEPTKSLRRIYRSRISNLPNTFGMFTANICLKPDSLKYPNRNIYVHTPEADLWHPQSDKTESVLVHYYPSANGFATHLDLLSPMSYEPLEPWKDCKVGHRGEEYEALKARKAEECLSLASSAIEGLEGSIDKVFTSSPLTYLSYTGSPFGSAYGLRKDFSNPMGTVLSPKSPIPNLFFTGQSLNLHGILGVSMTSLLTCKNIGI